MLNPPLSLLSSEVLAHIVEHLASFPNSHVDLCNLAVSDRAFTHFSQNGIFHKLVLGNKLQSESRIPHTLEKIGNILNKNPSFIDRVRVVELIIPLGGNAWIFDDPTFTCILNLLAESPRPPETLLFGWATIEDPIVVVDRLTQSFFSQTLTTLRLDNCENIPLTFFLICAQLRDVVLDGVGVAKKSYPDNQCSGREAPALEVFHYRSSQSLVEQMITPPCRFHTPVVLWSKLRSLTLCPFETQEMACLQPILNAACNSLEELYLTWLRGSTRQIPLAGLVNLSELSHLRVFALLVFINGSARKPMVLHDINIVLGRIPASNKVTNLSFDFNIFGKRPFRGCLDDDWAGLYEQIIRISAEKPLELDLQLLVDSSKARELCATIKEGTAVLSNYPDICTHFWDPSGWDRGLRPFPRGQERGKCRH